MSEPTSSAPASAIVIGTGSIGEACKNLLVVNGSRKVHWGSRSTGQPIDVTDERSIEGFMGLAFCDQLTAPSTLILAHGAEPCITPTLVTDPKKAEEIILTDLLGPWRVARQFAKYVLSWECEKSIVFISSYHALGSYPGRAAYAAAKAGIVGLTQALAIEWSCYQMTVNCVLPGQVYSKRSEKLLSDADQKEADSHSPNLRCCYPDEVAEAAINLTKMRHVNGHSLVIDGGWSKDLYWKR